MKLHTCIVTHNRLDLTIRVIESYLETVTLPHTLVVVDNHSTDGTREWLLEEFDYGVVLLNENRYPGFACNRGWECAPLDATHLHRQDNDFAFLPGWCETVMRGFAKKPVAQLGLRTPKEERSKTNVGGCNIIRRDLWDAGLRYDERPWPELTEAIGYGCTEDTLLSPRVKEMGWNWKRVSEPCIVSLARDDPTDDYYRTSWKDRNILEWALEKHGAVPDA